MSRPQVLEIGKLQYSETNGLRCQGSPGSAEVLPKAMQWPGIEMTRNPTARDIEAYLRALHADPTYRQAAKEFLERQRLKPQARVFGLASYWAYKDTVFQVESDKLDIAYYVDTAPLLIKHFMLTRSRSNERIRREVEVLENLEKLPHVEREPIPKAVRLYVWQRDKGQCVQCGSRQHLEFDHVIPIAAGGSNTERNIQLLCESCNRVKGATI